MINKVVWGIFVSVGLVSAGIAVAQEGSKGFSCQPTDAALGTAYNIQCRTIGGVLDETDPGCACVAGFVLVDPLIQPAAVPPVSVPLSVPSPG